MENLTFEDYLKNNLTVGNEFRLVAKNDNGHISFYCHTLGRDGETYDAYVSGFTIYPQKALDNLQKAVFKNPAK